MIWKLIPEQMSVSVDDLKRSLWITLTATVVLFLLAWVVWLEYRITVLSDAVTSNSVAVEIVIPKVEALERFVWETHVPEEVWNDSGRDADKAQAGE